MNVISDIVYFPQKTMFERSEAPGLCPKKLFSGVGETVGLRLNCINEGRARFAVSWLWLCIGHSCFYLLRLIGGHQGNVITTALVKQPQFFLLQGELN